MTLALTNIKRANLTDTPGGNTFTVTGWTNTGSLTNTGATPDTVAVSSGGDYTLTNSSLTSSTGLNLTLSGIGTANLTETAGGHTFTVSGWTGGGTEGVHPA